jgi:hypothetical protein
MKKFSAVLLSFFLLAAVYAQPLTDSLEGFVVKQYTSHFKAAREWFYTQINKQVFLPGEAIWFKTYVLDDVSRKPFLGTRNLYAELLNNEGRLIYRKTLYVNKGTSFGSFNLSDSLPGGVYLFRVYTGYSRNFGPEAAFSQWITVAGKKTIPLQVPEPGKEYRISFFPEGGVLLAHAENRIAYEILRPDGSQGNLSGVLIRNGKELKKLPNTIQGRGSFITDAFNSDSLQLAFTLPDGSIQNAALPKPREKGVKLALKELGKDSITITVRTNFETMKELGGKRFYLLVHRLGAVHHMAWVSFVNRMQFLHYSFATSGLPEGVVHLTLFDDHYQPVSDRAVFIDKKASIPLAVTYQREEDTLVVSAASAESLAGASLSVSVLPGGTKASQFTSSILSRYLLESDIQGFLPNPSHYFDGQHGRKEELDLLLLVQAWRTYNWKSILEEAPPELTFPFEQGFDLGGTVPGFKELKDKGSGEVVLFSPENDLVLKSTLDSQGRFGFHYLSLWDSSIIYINAQNLKDRKKYGSALASLSPAGYDTIRPALNMPEFIGQNIPDASPLLDRGKMMAEIKIKTRAQPQEKEDPFRWDVGIKSSDKIAIIDKDAITRYRSLMDLLQQKFFVRFYREDSTMELHADMRGGASSILLRNDPRLIVDGMEMPMSQVERLLLSDIKAVAINRLSSPGVAFGAGGSIIIRSRKDNEGLVEDESNLIPYLQRIMVKGYDLPASWYLPAYTLPVGHSLFEQYAALHWIPNWTTDSKGNLSFRCYLPRSVKEVQLRIEGITKEGRLISVVEKKKL